VYDSEGYPEPWWLKPLIGLQPGLWPVAVLTNPIPVYIRANWRHYTADVACIVLVWYLVGVYFDHRAKSFSHRRLVSLELRHTLNFPTSAQRAALTWPVLLAESRHWIPAREDRRGAML
jgi:uncharacterized membrane protein